MFTHTSRGAVLGRDTTNEPRTGLVHPHHWRWETHRPWIPTAWTSLGTMDTHSPPQPGPLDPLEAILDHAQTYQTSTRTAGGGGVSICQLFFKVGTPNGFGCTTNITNIGQNEQWGYIYSLFDCVVGVSNGPFRKPNQSNLEQNGKWWPICCLFAMDGMSNGPLRTPSLTYIEHNWHWGAV